LTKSCRCSLYYCLHDLRAQVTQAIRVIQLTRVTRHTDPGICLAGYPSTMDEKPLIRATFQLPDLSYAPPSAKALSTRLLEKAYTRQMKSKGRG
jgi:hypothetical protein